MILTLTMMTTLGCHISNPDLKKDSEGYFVKHYNACGPIALEKAINEYHARIANRSIKASVFRNELSREIQDGGFTSRRLLSLVNASAINITWPSEIKEVLNKHGFEIVKVKSLNELDKQKDIAIVLIHGKFFRNEYHWIVYPIDNVKTLFGKNTVIELIYLIRKK